MSPVRRKKAPVAPCWKPLELADSWTADSDPAIAAALAADESFVGVYLNDRYQVTMHRLETSWGLCNHLAIVRRDRSAVHDWRDLQRIKNELCGAEREALEIYPAESRLVDTNNQFHLWVLPAGMAIPFGYAERDVGDVPFGRHQQRPFDEPPVDLNAKAHVPAQARARIVVPGAKE